MATFDEMKLGVRIVNTEEEPPETTEAPSDAGSKMVRSAQNDAYHKGCKPSGCDYAAKYLGTPPGLAGDAAARKAAPMASGVLFYFPNALAAVAALSKVGNDQHNPGEPMHWAFDKSTDEADCIVRHLAQSGAVDNDGVLHSTKVAWRALALLERELLHHHPAMQPGKNVKGFKR